MEDFGKRIRKPAHPRALFLVILAALIFGIYYNTLDNAPTNWDDPALFSRPTIHKISADNLKKVLSFHPGATYQPIRDISYMIDFSFWGKKVVLGMHLHSILLYYLMIVACWAFLLELFQSFDIEEKKCFIWATLSCLIFAVHTVHVECVTWLYARKEPLLGIFTFLSLWSFIKAISGRRYNYITSAIFLILGILSKPTALMIPGVMLAIDLALYAKGKGKAYWRTRLVVYIPIIIIVAPMAFRLISMMSAIGGIKPYHGGSFWTNLLAVSQIMASYIKLISLTINYAADYPVRLYADPNLWQAWAFVTVNIIIISSAIWAFFKGRYIYSIFVGWYYVFLLPVSHIFPISQILTDRYALLPSLSWCVLLGYILSRLWEMRIGVRWLSKDFLRLVSVALLSIIILSYSAMTVRQNDIWQNSQTLWEDTLAKYPNSSPANVNLSVIYITQGKYKEAQDLCINAVKQVPYDYMAISNLALAQMMMGQYDNAIHNYGQALRLKSDLSKAKLGLANAYWKKGNFINVYRMYEDMVTSHNIDKISYGNVIYYRLGYSAWKLDMREKALIYYKKAVSLGSRSPMLLKDLADSYTSMGKIPEALDCYKKAGSIAKGKDLKDYVETRIRMLSHEPTCLRESHN
ncbi:MAG: tetratricopeptide repeat protein [Deltaproteobacteria bacterium]|nr:tetratricopeptide repeat protein [Deltaproteobacteria bacterium]